MSFIQVIDWVLGPGETYLSSSSDVGDSVTTCELLRKEHEEFELSARVRRFLCGWFFAVERRILLSGGFCDPFVKD